MPRNSHTNLFRGTGYEYYVISQLLIKEYEAYKLPVDFGFDLAVCKPSDSDEYDKNRENDIYYFQIKSGVLSDLEEQKSIAGNRSDMKAKFRINKHQIKKLLKSDHAFLVCCLVKKEENEEQLQGMFCLGKTQIEYLEVNEFLKDNKKEYILDVIFSPKAKLIEQYQKEIDILNSELKGNAKGLNSLNKLNTLLVKSDIINTKTNNNIYLLKNKSKYFLNHYFYGIENFEIINELANYSYILSKSK